MATIVFKFLIVILIGSLLPLISSQNTNLPAYVQGYPGNNYRQLIQPVRPIAYYQKPTSDESIHQSNYYPSNTQQNYGQIKRRSTPAFTLQQVPCPYTDQQLAQYDPRREEVDLTGYRCYRSIPTPKIPLYPLCDAHNQHIKEDLNYLTPSFNQQGRDSRSILDSLYTKNDDVAPVTTVPNYVLKAPMLSTSSINEHIKVPDSIDDFKYSTEIPLESIKPSKVSQSTPFLQQSISNYETKMSDTPGNTYKLPSKVHYENPLSSLTSLSLSNNSNLHTIYKPSIVKNENNNSRSI